MSPSEWERRYVEAEKILGVLSNPTAESQTGNSIKTRIGSILENGRVIRGLPLSGRFLEDGDIYFNAPWDMLAAVKPQTSERIKIRPGVKVTRIVYKNDRISGTDIVGPNDLQDHLHTSSLLIAGGAVGTPQLLSRSGIRPTALGQGFSFHALLFGQVVLDPTVSAPASVADVAPRLWIPPTTSSPWHIQVLRDTFPAPTTEAVENPHRLLEFQAFLPIEFRDDNRFVFKENNETEVQFDFSENDQVLMQAMEQDVRQLASRLGPWRGGGELAWVPHGTAHLVGTCRMDRPSWEGVADRQARVHGFKNLYLATVGLIPAPVAVNPTLTAVALALKTSDVLVSEV
jgi:choline dehydrogenase-like flavoprotein